MPRRFYEKDGNIDALKGKKIAIIGYGSQGHAHALNLRDSGLDVVVGLPKDSKSRAKATAAGLTVLTPAEAAKAADVMMVLVPDHIQGDLYSSDIAPNLTKGKTLMFAHGFNIHFGFIKPPADVDVSMIAPKAPGHRVREVFVEGSAFPPSSRSSRMPAARLWKTRWPMPLRSAVCAPASSKPSFREETESDLFGEQAVLCGGAAELIRAGFETLVEAGYAPEIAYFECLHELKLIVDLIYEGGLGYMRFSVSDTAEYGDYTRGPRIINAETRKEMKKILSEIQSGEFAKQWIGENKAGRQKFLDMRAAQTDQPIENVGRELRKMMTFLKRNKEVGVPVA